jgi:hypothetical protein
VESCRRPKDWIQHVALLLRNGRTRRSRYKKAGFCTAATAEDPVAKWGGFSGAIETNRQSSQSQLLVIPSKLPTIGYAIPTERGKRVRHPWPAFRPLQSHTSMCKHAKVA